MTHHAPLKKQRGAVLWMLLIAIIMAGGFAFYRSANLQSNHVQQSNKLAITMARAKEALIARAVTDDNRPGSLPCPDLITNSPGLNNVPGDGKSDMFTMTQCPSYVGWLPWVTLDLPELTDGTGTRLWYVLAPALRDDDSAHPINSRDTAIDLQVDGSNDVTALIIAPSAPLSGQSRPSNNPADYLDDENGNGNDRKYITGPQSATFNDIVLVITRQELMAAVEKRVANELKSCLDQHAASPGNTEHRYPWPAPFSASNFEGKAGSYFGQVPSTQPSSGPDLMLQKSIVELGAARSALSSASNPSQQLAIVENTTELLTFARNIFDALYIAATKLWQTSQANATNLASLTTELAKDLTPNSSGNVSVIDSEQTRIRTQADTAYQLISDLPAALAASGIDAFPNELKKRSATFETQASAGNAQAILDLLSRSTANHIDIAPRLSTAINASLIAIDAAKAATTAPNDSTLATTAASTASALLAATNALQNTIQNSRINTHFSEINPYANGLESLNTTLRVSPNTDTAAALASKLSEAKALIDHIATGTSTIVTARNTALQALTSALLAAQAAVNFPLIDSSTANAISQIKTLTTQMTDNDDNLTRSSLAVATANFTTAQSAFASLNIVSTSDRVPYAESLQSTTVDVNFWAKIIATEAYDLASRSKALPIATNIDFASVAALDTSAYRAASNALSRTQASTTALQNYLKTPTKSKETAATNALATTASQLDTMLGQAGNLESTLSSSAASAFPTIWYSRRCDFLQPSLAGWWKTNEWSKTLFYQISNVLMSAPGNLKVNGTAGYRVVSIAAGQEVFIITPGSPPTVRKQDHINLRSAANFFEGINADPSRDGNASSPSPNFENRSPFVDTTISPSVTTFNDRLAY